MSDSSRGLTGSWDVAELYELVGMAGFTWDVSAETASYNFVCTLYNFHVIKIMSLDKLH